MKESLLKAERIYTYICNDNNKYIFDSNRIPVESVPVLGLIVHGMPYLY